jgi:hypothetical protein
MYMWWSSISFSKDHEHPNLTTFARERLGQVPIVRLPFTKDPLPTVGNGMLAAIYMTLSRRQKW